MKPNWDSNSGPSLVSCSTSLATQTGDPSPAAIVLMKFKAYETNKILVGTKAQLNVEDGEECDYCSSSTETDFVSSSTDTSHSAHKLTPGSRKSFWQLRSSLSVFFISFNSISSLSFSMSFLVISSVVVQASFSFSPLLCWMKKKCMHV